LAIQIIEGFTAFLLLCGAVYLYWVHVARRLTTIRSGYIYHAGAMRPAQLLRVARRLKIDTVIDFRGDKEMPQVRIEQRALEHTGIRHAHVPSGNLPCTDTLRSFIALMGEELDSNHRVLMHCKDGEGRVVAFAAVYRMEFEGWSPLAAYRATTRLPPALRFITWILPFAGRLSGGNAKSRMILSYTPQLARPSDLGAVSLAPTE
jgi:protein tyrosine phosphatase (PTP) superfamily phosphohydrolase (DUF442 family)